MQIQVKPPLHLTYSLGIHPGETWAAQARAIRETATVVKSWVAPRRPFGLGLRLGARAAATLRGRRAQHNLAALLRAHDLYVFTLNGFPYGAFHGRAVKERVYAPDWRTPERARYTSLLAELLAALLPEGVAGSISTVPVSFRPWMRGARDLERAQDHLLAVAGRLHALEQRTGRLVRLGLEPEPGCHLESLADTLAFFRALREHACRSGVPERRLLRHVGVCLDACHAAVGFEDPLSTARALRRAGIRIVKVQLSAALRLRPTPAALRALAEFDEPVYLHQVVESVGRVTRRWTDLGPARREAQAGPPAAGEWRAHFHVPLYWRGAGGLGSTAGMLSPALWSWFADGGTEHLEIETYSYHALPAAVRRGALADSIIREYRWVLRRLRG